jgi:NAD(P)H-dependent nitrite reductase small subunit
LSAAWHRVCGLDDILPNSGVAALVEGRQIAMFRVGDALYAVGNYDPASGINVLSRGIVGDVGGEIVVASPLYKQHYSLVTGRCLENTELRIPAYLTRVADGEAWVKSVPVVQRRAARRRRLVVIGNGTAAMRTLEELLEVAPHEYQITVFGSEPQSTYNRVLLSPLLAGEKRLEEIVTHTPEWFEERRITLHRADPVMAIDRIQRCVRSRSGASAAYDRLLIATGSHPIVLPVPGKDLAGVVTFRDVNDVDAMLASAAKHPHAVVIGGGLLGLEAASGLRRRGMQVTVVHIAPHLMERQLDVHAAALLRSELERRGITFVLPAVTMRLLGSDHVSGVELTDGRTLPASLVVMAVGVRPNVALAQAAGLPCDRGLLVDDTMSSNDPSIYAVGECVQHRGRTFGLVAPLLAQARVCAASLAERGARGYSAAQDATQLKVSGIDVFSAGNYEPGTGCESLVLRDAKRGIYKRLVIQHDRIRGAVLYGDTRDSGWYLQLIKDGSDIRSFRDELLFGKPAEQAAGAA